MLFFIRYFQGPSISWGSTSVAEGGVLGVLLGSGDPEQLGAATRMLEAFPLSPLHPTQAAGEAELLESISVSVGAGKGCSCFLCKGKRGSNPPRAVALPGL